MNVNNKQSGTNKNTKEIIRITIPWYGES